MTYDRKILRRSLEQYERDKERRAESFKAQQRKLYREIPRLEEIERELRGTVSQVVATALQRGMDPVPALQDIRDRNLALQRERAALLLANGYEPDALEERPGCALCDDTGFRGGVMCRCLQKYYARIQIEDLSSLLDMGSASFETFDFSWYDRNQRPEYGLSPYQSAKDCYRQCETYANNFAHHSGNLLLTGGPGLGKTFLSACIARVVSEDGFSVVYDTAGHIFAQMEKVKFSREDNETAEEDVNRFFQCDLLIMDDLGMEMTTTFVQSALYQIVNTRLITGKKTIINTNLNPEDIEARYSAQVSSRIEGEYKILLLIGEDIRRQKRDK